MKDNNLGLAWLTNNVHDAVVSAEGSDNFLPSIKQFLTDIVDSSVLRLDCAKRILANVESGDPQPNIFHDEGHRHKIRVAYWSPGQSNSPHNHSTWVVTGVLYNKLQVKVYNDTVNDGEKPVLDRVVTASQGDVGSLVPPGVHSVGNVSDDMSVSFHIYRCSPCYEERVAKECWFSGEEAKRISDEDIDINNERLAYEREVALKAAAVLLKSVPKCDSFGVLEKIYQLAAHNSTKLQVLAAITSIDDREGRELADNLLAATPELLALLQQEVNSHQAA
jgi:predicted metal-dependent enzyme (double-stranded beta helix superfamily)